MAKTAPTRKLRQVMGTGLADLPTNAAWLLSKALKPASGQIAETTESAADTATSAVSRVQRTAKTTRRAVTDAIPHVPDHSVESQLAQANAAAEHASEQEARALALAQDAKDKAREAGAAQGQARTAIGDAEDALDQARELASQAAQAARELADQASRDAARLAGNQHAPTKRQPRPSARARSRVARTVPRPRQGRPGQSRPGQGRPGQGRSGQGQSGQGQSGRLTDDRYLGSLTKRELQRLATERRLPADHGRRPADMTKEQLAAAIVRAGGVRLDALTKAELLRLARSQSKDVSGSMTKQDLIAAVNA
jgi:hypothetical protein